MVYSLRSAFVQTLGAKAVLELAKADLVAASQLNLAVGREVIP
jgi:hypothetical protein